MADFVAANLCKENVRSQRFAVTQEAFLLARKIQGARRYGGDRSTFSALNIDVQRRAATRLHVTLTIPSVSGRRQVVAELGSCAQFFKKQAFQRCRTVSSGDETSSPGSDEILLSSDTDVSEQEMYQQPGTSDDGSNFAEARKYLLGFRKAAFAWTTPSTCQGLNALPFGARCSAPAAPKNGMAKLVASNRYKASEQSDPAILQSRGGTEQFRSGQATAAAASAPARPPGEFFASSAGCASPSPPSTPALLRRVSGTTPASPHGDLRCSIQSLLNKVCPENVHTIAEKIAKVQLCGAHELDIIIQLIFNKALAEPHYCETYADLVIDLKTAFPQFPAREGCVKNRPVSFKVALLEELFKQFDTALQPQPLGDADTAADVRRQSKDRVCANMKFLGHLFLRQLLSAKVVGSVCRELVLCDGGRSEMPHELALECAVELLMAIGFTLEALPHGQPVVEEVFHRLKTIKGAQGPDGKLIYSKRIQFMIQDLQDARSAGWSKKSFKASAKTKEEIRLDQERDLRQGMLGRTCSGKLVLAGRRPDF
mmetsp:Transcript_42101/g.136247  ORF Transcript_42101/g.136247 Transcript_42101/m.136247 type:complete len:541 (-) Transcript_42101:128-1750(-)